MGKPIRNCEGQPKRVGGFEAFSESPLCIVLKESNYTNWDTLELAIWIPDH